jgi:hypothetical protein
MRRLGVLACVALTVLTGCSLTLGSAQPSPAYHVSDALPSDGWKPGMVEMLAAFGGPFHAAIRDGTACAWLGSGDVAFVWPAGYSVRFHPTELLNAKDRVIARSGQVVGFAGGVEPGSPADPGERCKPKSETGWQYVAVEGLPETRGP